MPLQIIHPWARAMVELRLLQLSPPSLVWIKATTLITRATGGNLQPHAAGLAFWLAQPGAPGHPECPQRLPRGNQSAQGNHWIGLACYSMEQQGIDHQFVLLPLKQGVATTFLSGVRT